MHAALNIDPINGLILLGPLEIIPKTTISGLSNTFSIGEEMLVSVVGKKVDRV
jgi:hypothetical protein